MNRYSTIKIIKNPNNKRYYSENKYPEVPFSGEDIWVVTTTGDRYDSLALQYYGDKSLWWIIPASNNHLEKNSLYPPIGIQIRIPVNTSTIISNYRKLNTNT